MIFAVPAQKIDPKSLKAKDHTKRLVLAGSIVRVKMALPGEGVETEGDLAVPVYVVNEDPTFNEDWPVDPDEPIQMVLRYDLPATGITAIPVYLITEDVDARGMEVQGSQTEETERRRDQTVDPQRGLQDWTWGAQGLPEDDGDLVEPAEVRSADLGQKG